MLMLDNQHSVDKLLRGIFNVYDFGQVWILSLLPSRALCFKTRKIKPKKRNFKIFLYFWCLLKQKRKESKPKKWFMCYRTLKWFCISGLGFLLSLPKFCSPKCLSFYRDSIKNLKIQSLRRLWNRRR